VSDRASWEAEAANWVRWARTEGHDAYWYYRDAFFDRIVPPPGRLTLEVGCGEGRVARDLVARGHTVVAVDGSPTLLAHAVAADSTSSYVRADAASLPLADGACDVVVAYNSLMDVDDMPGTVAEAARTLCRGGSLCICITHPVVDGGHFDGDGPDAPYVLADVYMGTSAFDAVEFKRDLSMHFRGWHHSLEVYVSAIVGAGLIIDALHEPVPADPTADYERWRRYPMFLQLRAVKR